MHVKAIALLVLLVCLPTLADSLSGYYVGDFIADHKDDSKNPMRRNRINISIDSVKQDKVVGHSVVAGNKRPFRGSIALKNGKYVVTAQEPGDDPYDGAFQFTLNPQNHHLVGIWIANDKKLAVTQRRYNLERKVFKYNPDQPLGQLPSRLHHGGFAVYDSKLDAEKIEAISRDAGRINASNTLLTSHDLENMYKSDLEVMRNAIYARHGYSFQNRDMRFVFDSVDWYIPVSIDVTAELTQLEKQNIEILKRYEKHAATYYDRFGR